MRLVSLVRRRVGLLIMLRRVGCGRVVIVTWLLLCVVMTGVRALWRWWSCCGYGTPCDYWRLLVVGFLRCLLCCLIRLRRLLCHIIVLISE